MKTNTNTMYTFYITLICILFVTLVGCLAALLLIMNDRDYHRSEGAKLAKQVKRLRHYAENRPNDLAKKK